MKNKILQYLRSLFINHRLYFRILLYFLLLDLIVLIAGVSTFFSFRNSVRSQFQTDVHESFESITEAVSEEYAEAFRAGSVLMGDYYLSSCFMPYQDAGKEDKIRMLKIQTILNNTKSLIESLEDIVILSSDEMLFLCDGMIMYDTYFEEIVVYDHVDKSVWRDYYNRSSGIYFGVPYHVTRPFSNPSSKRVLPILSNGYINGYKVTVIATIDLSAIQKTFERGLRYPSSVYYVEDPDGNIVFTNLSDRNIINSEYEKTKDGYIREYYHLSLTTAVNGWNYQIFVPKFEYSRGYTGILTLSLWISGILLLLGIVLSVIFARKFYSPMYNVIQRLKGLPISSDNSEPTLNTIANSVGNLADRYQSLLNVVPGNTEMMLRLYLSWENRASEKLKNELISSLKGLYAFQDRYYCCVNVSFVFTEAFEKNNETIEESVKAVLQSLLGQEFGSVARFCQIELSNDSYCFILNIPDNNADDIRRKVEQLLMVFHVDILYYETYFGISEISENLEDLWSCNNHARTALDYSIHVSQAPITFAEELIITDQYNYTTEEENQISSLLHKKEMRELNSFIHSVLNKNIRSYVSWYGNHQLLNAIDRSCSRLLGLDKAVDSDPIEIGDSLENHVNEIMEKYYSSVMNQSAQVDNENQIVSSVRSYVEEHYQEDLSLTGIGDAMGYNPKYLSRIFKENYGSNLSDYINMVRLQNAKELILNTNLTLDKIHNQIGIPSKTTFIRIFKKYEGISPGEYREIHSIMQDMK